MSIGAILTVASQTRADGEISDGPGSVRRPFLTVEPMALWELLGRRVLDHVLQRLQSFGIQNISIISEETSPSPYPGPADGTFWQAWEKAASQHLNRGVTTLLLLRLGPYLEIDLLHLLRFHRDKDSALTQVYGKEHALDFVVVEAAYQRRG